MMVDQRHVVVSGTDRGFGCADAIGARPSVSTGETPTDWSKAGAWCPCHVTALGPEPANRSTSSKKRLVVAQLRSNGKGFREGAAAKNDCS